MMKSAVFGVVLLNFIILLACTKVQVEILQPAGESEKRTPIDDKKVKDGEIPEQQLEQRGAPRGALRSDFIVLTQTGANSCATDRNVTRAVAQDTGVWCWAASAQGVMSFHNVNRLQCDIVNKVKAGNETTGSKPFCCENKLEGKCQKNGWPDEVFDAYGIDYKWLEGSLTQQQVAGQICGNGPFTYSIAYEGGGGHTFVVKDYWMEGPEEMALWRDSHEYFTDERGERYPAGFSRVSYKEYAEGLYDGTSTVDFTYILIKALD